jgi:hypothetical protein
METTLQGNKGRYQAAGPLGASLLFHALLIAVLNGTSSFDFTVGNQTRFDILWLAAADLASPSAQTAKELASAATSPQQSPQSGEDQEKPFGDEIVKELPSSNVSTPAMDLTEALALAIPAAAEIKRGTKAKRWTKPAIAENGKAAAEVKPQHKPLPAPAASPVTAAPEQEKKRHATPLPAAPPLDKNPETKAAGTLADSPSSADEKERARRAKSEHRSEPETTAARQELESAPQLEVFQIVPTVPVRPVSANAARREPAADVPVTRSARIITIPSPEPARITTAKQVPAAPKVMQPPAPPVKIAAAAKHPAPPTAKVAAPRVATPAATGTKTPTAGHLQIAAKAPTAPLQVASPPLTAPPAAHKAAVEKADGKAAIAANHEGGKGVVLSSLHGDLKLVMAGDPALRLTVSFRDFPKSRRIRTQSRSEARNQKRIQPIFAKNGQQAREAVIGTAREGVYVFIVEPEHAAAARGSFTLKLYESGAKEKVVSIGTRTVSSSTVIARVLMPEGILWDDDEAFSGSMEDSESTTKFNTQTGLYWKEYND